MVTRVSGPYEYNAICDGCGRKFKASELRKRWDGYMMCKDDWEPRHSLDFYRVKNDSHQLPFSHPESEDIDVSPSTNLFGATDPTAGTAIDYDFGTIWLNTSSGDAWFNIETPIDTGIHVWKNYRTGQRYG